MSSDDDDNQDCPLCLEAFDATDRNFRPCTCGYQVCLWCYHRLKAIPNGDLCPACRQPYRDSNIQFTKPDPEELQQSKPAPKKKKRPGSGSGGQSKSSLADVRVLQRNLCYVVGLPPAVAKEDVLRRKEYFGRFGRIVKVAINRKASHHAGGQPSYSAYVTFKKSKDAGAAIAAVHGTVMDGRVLRATHGTTKYCSYFLRNVACTNPGCLYLHELADPNDCYTKEQLVAADRFALPKNPPALPFPLDANAARVHKATRKLTPRHSALSSPRSTPGLSPFHSPHVADQEHKGGVAAVRLGGSAAAAGQEQPRSLALEQRQREMSGGSGSRASPTPDNVASSASAGSRGLILSQISPSRAGSARSHTSTNSRANLPPFRSGKPGGSIPVPPAAAAGFTSTLIQTGLPHPPTDPASTWDFKQFVQDLKIETSDELPGLKLIRVHNALLWQRIHAYGKQHGSPPPYEPVFSVYSLFGPGVPPAYLPRSVDSHGKGNVAAPGGRALRAVNGMHSSVGDTAGYRSMSTQQKLQQMQQQGQGHLQQQQQQPQQQRNNSNNNNNSNRRGKNAQRKSGRHYRRKSKRQGQKGMGDNGRVGDDSGSHGDVRIKTLPISYSSQTRRPGRGGAWAQGGQK